jgi:hypothetical protein
MYQIAAHVWQPQQAPQTSLSPGPAGRDVCRVGGRVRPERLDLQRGDISARAGVGVETLCVGRRLFIGY